MIPTVKGKELTKAEEKTINRAVKGSYPFSVPIYTGPTYDEGFSLFFSCFSPDDQERLKRDGYVCIRGSNGGLYAVLPGSYDIGRIYGGNINFYCLVPDDTHIPIYDRLLTKILWIITNETWFLQTAH